MQGKTLSTSRIPPIISCMSEVLLLFRVPCFYPPLCTNCLSACCLHLVSSLRAVPEMDFLPAAALWGDSTLFGADSVGARFPAGSTNSHLQKLPAHPFCKHTKWVIGHTNAYLHCNLAFVYTVMDFFHVQMWWIQVQNGCPQEGGGL